MCIRDRATTVRAHVLSATLLECITPSQTAPGVASLEVSINGQDFSNDEVLFEYQQLIRLDDVSPSRGPSSGGSALVITGAGFSRRSALLGYTLARFNTTRVPAAWVSSTELRCVSPSHASGLARLEVTQNDQQYSEASALRFEYEDMGSCSIEPRSGPVRGSMLQLPMLSLIHI